MSLPSWSMPPFDACSQSYSACFLLNKAMGHVPDQRGILQTDKRRAVREPRPLKSSSSPEVRVLAVLCLWLCACCTPQINEDRHLRPSVSSVTMSPGPSEPRLAASRSLPPSAPLPGASLPLCLGCPALFFCSSSLGDFSPCLKTACELSNKPPQGLEGLTRHAKGRRAASGSRSSVDGSGQSRLAESRRDALVCRRPGASRCRKTMSYVGLSKPDACPAETSSTWTRACVYGNRSFDKPARLPWKRNSGA